MNLERRKRLREVCSALSVQAAELESIREDEDEARDNMPESLVDTDRYAASEEASEAIDAAIESIESATASLEDIM